MGPSPELWDGRDSGSYRTGPPWDRGLLSGNEQPSVAGIGCFSRYCKGLPRWETYFSIPWMSWAMSYEMPLWRKDNYWKLRLHCFCCYCMFLVWLQCSIFLTGWPLQKMKNVWNLWWEFWRGQLWGKITIFRTSHLALVHFQINRCFFQKPLGTEAVLSSPLLLNWHAACQPISCRASTGGVSPGKDRQRGRPTPGWGWGVCGKSSS